jgi:hypothetical protein
MHLKKMTFLLALFVWQSEGIFNAAENGNAFHCSVLPYPDELDAFVSQMGEEYEMSNSSLLNELDRFKTIDELLTYATDCHDRARNNFIFEVETRLKNVSSQKKKSKDAAKLDRLIRLFKHVEACPVYQHENGFRDSSWGQAIEAVMNQYDVPFSICSLDFENEISDVSVESSILIADQSNDQLILHTLTAGAWAYGIDQKPDLEYICARALIKIRLHHLVETYCAKEMLNLLGNKGGLEILFCE